jgi:hypothetical protein
MVYEIAYPKRYESNKVGGVFFSTFLSFSSVPSADQWAVKWEEGTIRCRARAEGGGGTRK